MKKIKNFLLCSLLFVASLSVSIDITKEFGEDGFTLNTVNKLISANAETGQTCHCCEFDSMSICIEYSDHTGCLGTRWCWQT